MKNLKNINNMPLALALLLTISLGCLGPSASDSQCEGIVESNGQRFIGKAKDEAQAGLNACNKYCLDMDEKAKGMVRDWLASDAAAEFERKSKRKPTKEDAVIEDKRILDYVTGSCAVRCKAEANKGKHSLETKCGK